MNFSLKRDVTLVCVDGSDPNTSLQALKFSNRDIGFSNIKLISTNVPELDMAGIEYHQIPPMTWDGYQSTLMGGFLFRLRLYWSSLARR